MSIFSVVIITVIVDLLLSGSRLAKTVNAVSACIMLLLIVTPISSLFSDKKIEFSLDGYSPQLDESYLNYVSGQKSEAISQSIKNGLSDYGVSGAQVSVNLSSNGGEEVIQSVEINLSQSVIDEKFVHINKNELVRQWLRENLNLDETRIIIYG